MKNFPDLLDGNVLRVRVVGVHPEGVEHVKLAVPRARVHVEDRLEVLKFDGSCLLPEHFALE